MKLQDRHVEYAVLLCDPEHIAKLVRESRALHDANEDCVRPKYNLGALGWVRTENELIGELRRQSYEKTTKAASDIGECGSLARAGECGIM